MRYLSPELDPAARLVTFVDPDDPQRWPAAPRSAACIFEAILILGRALVPTWTGAELRAVRWPESPNDERIRLTRLANAISRAPRPITPIDGSPIVASPVKQQASGGLSGVLNTFTPSVEQLAEWHHEQQAKWEANVEATRRLKAMVDCLAQLARDGAISTYARLTSGGDLWPMRAAEWNIDDPLEQFVSNGGFKRYFPGWDRPGPWDCFIFVDRAALLHVLSVYKGDTEHAPASADQVDPFSGDQPITNQATGKSLASAEAAFRAWLPTAFADDPEKKLKKPDFWNRGRKLFPGLSRRGFDRVWGRLAPQAKRSQPGRKSSRRIETAN